jgi:tetratricopeptide (TPR) repeat protein
VHGALGDYEEALIPLQLAYSQGLLTDESELRRLAELLLYLDLPYRAAQVVERGIETKTMATASDTFELLSNSWIAAREFEKAVTPLERAADLSDNGELYVRLAQVHIQREKWSDAAEVLKLALDKGGLDNAGDAQLLMGIAYFSQKRPQQALTWFARAREHPETQDEADNWLKYIRRELRSS